MQIFCKETEAHLQLHPQGKNQPPSSQKDLITPELWLKDCRSIHEASVLPLLQKKAARKVSSNLDSSELLRDKSVADYKSINDWKIMNSYENMGDRLLSTDSREPSSPLSVGGSSPRSSSPLDSKSLERQGMEEQPVNLSLGRCQSKESSNASREKSSDQSRSRIMIKFGTGSNCQEISIENKAMNKDGDSNTSDEKMPARAEMSYSIEEAHKSPKDRFEVRKENNSEKKFRLENVESQSPYPSVYKNEIIDDSDSLDCDNTARGPAIRVRQLDTGRDQALSNHSSTSSSPMDSHLSPNANSSPPRLLLPPHHSAIGNPSDIQANLAHMFLTNPELLRAFQGGNFPMPLNPQFAPPTQVHFPPSLGSLPTMPHPPPLNFGPPPNLQPPPPPSPQTPQNNSNIWAQWANLFKGPSSLSSTCNTVFIPVPIPIPIPIPIPFPIPIKTNDTQNNDKKPQMHKSTKNLINNDITVTPNVEVPSCSNSIVSNHNNSVKSPVPVPKFTPNSNLISEENTSLANSLMFSILSKNALENSFNNHNIQSVKNNIIINRHKPSKSSKSSQNHLIPINYRHHKSSQSQSTEPVPLKPSEATKTMRERRSILRYTSDVYEMNGNLNPMRNQHWLEKTSNSATILKNHLTATWADDCKNNEMRIMDMRTNTMNSNPSITDSKTPSPRLIASDSPSIASPGASASRGPDSGTRTRSLSSRGGGGKETEPGASKRKLYDGKDSNRLSKRKQV